MFEERAIPSRPLPPELTASAPGERIETLDVLRGFALLGILLVNMQLFAYPVYAAVAGLPRWESGPEQIAAAGIRFLAESKFYPMFSFLFGLGFAIQMARAEARGASFVPLYARRLLALLAIGLAHALLLWPGDILVLYALLGFVLLLFRDRAPATLLLWAAACFLFSALLVVGLLGLTELGRGLPEVAQEIERELAQAQADYQAMTVQAIVVYSTGSFGEIMEQRVQDLMVVYSLMPLIAPGVFAMFVAGLYAGRRGFFQDLAGHLPLARKVLVWGLILGLPANFLYASLGGAASGVQPSMDLVTAALALAVGGPALCFAYVAGITLLLQHERWRRPLSVLAAPGRIALTNYLLQSLIATSIFYSYGLGLYGQIGPAAGVGLTLAIFFLVQVPLSNWWLGRFRFGPAEWLWRSITYWRLMPGRAPAP